MTVTDNTVVIYHGPRCLDGFTAAWAAHIAMPDAEYIPADHGDEPPNVYGKKVFMLDFSYPKNVIERMAAKGSSNIFGF